MGKRKSGILIHPTSFPGPYGCGDLGQGAYQVIDWLKKSGQSILQILAIGPTGFADSPYSSFCTFAGTPYIISFDQLMEKKLLDKNDLSDYPQFNPGQIDYGMIYHTHFKILRRAFENFKKSAYRDDFKQFCEKHQFWLNDYGLFMAIKDSKNGASWDLWEEELRDPLNLKNLSPQILEDSEFYQFMQWEFFKQWHDFKEYAHQNNVKIIGDIPFNVLYDSSDCWGKQELYCLDKNRKPSLVAGVPPDYFSETGQLWGNPNYRWDVMQKNGYKWWQMRISNLLGLVDCIKLDHFRGFEAYWEVQYGEKTAVKGNWIKGPGFDLFDQFKKTYGDQLNKLLIVEDLGLITKEVEQLRDHYHLSGMKVLEFANFEPLAEESEFVKNHYLPEYYIENCVAYPGTHDNNTLLGWYDNLTQNEKENVLDYLKIKDRSELNEQVITVLMQSKADLVIFLLQDILKLDGRGRINTPGTVGSHNWTWRITDGMLSDEIAAGLAEKTRLANR